MPVILQTLSKMGAFVLYQLATATGALVVLTNMVAGWAAPRGFGKKAWAMAEKHMMAATISFI